MKHFSDEQISAYFLGKMIAREAEAFETQTASDPELTEWTQAVERELIDDYLRGNLSADDVDCFEKNYLTTEVRRHRFSTAQGLWQIAFKESISGAFPQKSWRQEIFGKSRALRLAFACAALLICGAFAFYLLSQSVHRTDVAEVREPGEASKTANPPLQTTEDSPPANAEIQTPKPAPDNSAVQNRQTSKSSNTPPETSGKIKPVSVPKKIEPNFTALSSVVKLMPGSLRDEGEQSVTIAPNANRLTLLLSPASEMINYKAYRAIVKSPETGTVFTSPKLKALSVTIPAENLENRTYIIFLEGQNGAGEFESITEYTFRVRR